MSIRNDGNCFSNLNKLEETISGKLNELRNLPDDVKDIKNEDIKKMIRYYNAMTDKIEDRRNRINSFNLQLLAISITGMVLIISQRADMQLTDLGRFLFGTAILIISVLIISSLILSFLFEKQSLFRYPFLRLEKYGNNKWKWFYYGNKKILEINTNPVFRPKGTEKTLKPYLNGLSDFIFNYKEENLEKEITDNVQQLYLLQVHDYFKSRFFLQLTRVRTISFFIVFLIIICAIFYYVFLNSGFITCLLSLVAK